MGLFFFTDSCEDVHLIQHVHNATRSGGSRQPSLLLFLPLALVSPINLAPLGSSDHDLFLWNIHMFVSASSSDLSNLPIWNYSRGNYTCMLNLTTIFTS